MEGECSVSAGAGRACWGLGAAAPRPSGPHQLLRRMGLGLKCFNSQFAPQAQPCLVYVLMHAPVCVSVQAPCADVHAICIKVVGKGVHVGLLHLSLIASTLWQPLACSADFK